MPKYVVKKLKIPVPQADAPAAITDNHYTFRSKGNENIRKPIFICLNFNNNTFINTNIYVFNTHFQIFSNILKFVR